MMVETSRGSKRSRPTFIRRSRLGLSAVVLESLLLVPDPMAAQESVATVIDSLGAAEFNARPTAGLQIAVIKGGDTLYWGTWGSADIEHRVPLDRAAVFQIGSVTKQFTAAAVMRLVEQGRIRLDDDIRQYLPELDSQGQVVRLRQLLNHTSGIPNVYEMSLWPRIRPMRLLRPEAREYEVAGVAEDSLDFPPGTDYHYSNTGYDFLGDVVERVTGEDVETFFEREFFVPLGLDDTSFCPWKRILPNRAWGYEADSTNTFLENARRQSQGVLFTSGGICSTAPDLLRWNEALHHGRVVSDASYQAMITPEGSARTYGYGLFVNPLEGHARIRHNGYTPGFSSQLEYYPDDSLSLVVLANSAAAVQTLAEDIARATIGLPPRKVPTRPKGWFVLAFDSLADTTGISFRTMGSGMHVTAGLGAVYVAPDEVGHVFSLGATFLEAMGMPAPDEGHGLVFGGRGLMDPRGSYVAFLCRRSGEYALIRHAEGRQELVVPWTTSPLLNPGDMARNTLAVEVSQATVVLLVNGTSLMELPRSDLGELEGSVGLWIGPGYDVHIADFGPAGG